MLPKLEDPGTLSALNRLRFSEDGKCVRSYIEAAIASLDEANRTERDEIMLRWRQGAIQVLRELLAKQDKASEIEGNIRRQGQARSVRP